MTSKLNRAKDQLRSWASEHKKLRRHVKAVRGYWLQFEDGKLDAQEFTRLVATEFQFEARSTSSAIERNQP